LEDSGVENAAQHIVLYRTGGDVLGTAFSAHETAGMATILVSKTAFSEAETNRLRALSATDGSVLMAGPGMAPADATIAQLLVGSTRAAAIAGSPFDIAPPTDLRPYFFLQVRPTELLGLGGRTFGPITQITFNGVRVLMVVAACALLLVFAVMLLSVYTLPGGGAPPDQRRRYRLMTVYFLGIGLGYILVQLALHQRLVLVLGHPTLALSSVLFCMLMGTGAGAFLSHRLFPSGRLRRPALVILGALNLLWLVLPLVPQLEGLRSAFLRSTVVGSVILGIGFVLGFAFPLGVRAVAPTGEWAVQKVWAINGAASIAASVLAAGLGLVWGTAAVLASGILSYAVAFAAGVTAESRG
jgi:hypothetical protein